MKTKVILTVAIATLLGGCATTLHRGVVAMKIDAQTAHVGMNRSEVAVGDHVQLYGNKCTGGGRESAGDRSCTKIAKGHGQVTEILGNDYSVVKFDQGVSFSTGDFIELHSH